MKIYESSSKFSWWAWILPGLVLVPTVFWGLLPGKFVNILMISAVYFAALWWLISRRGQPGAGNIGLRISWIIFGGWALLSHYINGEENRNSVFVLVMAVLLMAIGTESQRWCGAAAALLALFGTLNAAVTVLMYFNDSLFQSLVKPRFYPDVAGATGYMSGLTPHYSYNATYIVYSLLVVVAILIFGRLARSARWFMVGLMVLNIFALLLTSKRAHFVVAVLAIIAVFGISRARGKYFKLLFGVTVLVVGLSYAAAWIPGIGASVDRMFSSASSGDLNEATTGRVVLWEKAIVGGLERPMTGQGWATFTHHWGYGTTGSTSHAHNQFLEVFYSLGFPGLIVFVALVTASLMMAYRVAVRICRSVAATRSQQLVAASAFAIQVFLVAYSGTTGTLLSESFTLVPYLLSIALSLALSPTATRLAHASSSDSVHGRGAFRASRAPVRNSNMTMS